MKRMRNCAEKLGNEINKITASLMGSGIVDDQNYAAIHKCRNDITRVEFKNSECISIAYKYNSYDQVYEELNIGKVYNFKLMDGGIFQMSYSFHKFELIAHRLAFYPSPELLPFREAPREYMRDELFLEINEKRLHAFPVRFDFNASDEFYINKNHPRCHLTLGDFESCRIPVSRPITPCDFIKFIIINFYKVTDYSFENLIPRSNFKFDETISKEEKKMMHICVS